MQACNVDIRAARLDSGAPPLGRQARNEVFQLHAADSACRCRFSRQMHRAPRPEEGAVRKIRRRMGQESMRGLGQLRDHRSAIAFQPEGGRPARRMVPAVRFRLDDQDRFFPRDFSSKACSGNAAANDQHVKM